MKVIVTAARGVLAIALTFIVAALLVILLPVVLAPVKRLLGAVPAEDVS